MSPYRWKNYSVPLKIDAKEFELARQGHQLPLHERINLRGRLAALREWVESIPEQLKEPLP